MVRAAINATVSPSHPSWPIPPVGGSAAGLGPRVGVPARPAAPVPAPAGVVALVVVPPVGAGVGVGVGAALGVAVGFGVSAASATHGAPSPTKPSPRSPGPRKIVCVPVGVKMSTLLPGELGLASSRSKRREVWPTWPARTTNWS